MNVGTQNLSNITIHYTQNRCTTLVLYCLWGVLNRFGKSVSRRPLPDGRGSVTHCKNGHPKQSRDRGLTVRERSAGLNGRNPQIGYSVNRLIVTSPLAD